MLPIHRPPATKAGERLAMRIVAAADYRAVVSQPHTGTGGGPDHRTKWERHGDHYYNEETLRILDLCGGVGKAVARLAHPVTPTRTEPGQTRL